MKIDHLAIWVNDLERMKEDKITIEPIGYLYTRYKIRQDTPSQGRNSENSLGTIVIKSKFEEGIRGIKQGDKITILFYFHKSKGFELTTIPYHSDKPTGVFCTRSPDRPNGIGITVVDVTDVRDNKIEFIGADMLDETPVLDIKPVI